MSIASLFPINLEHLNCVIWQRSKPTFNRLLCSALVTFIPQSSNFDMGSHIYYVVYSRVWYRIENLRVNQQQRNSSSPHIPCTLRIDCATSYWQLVQYSLFVVCHSFVCWFHDLITLASSFALIFNDFLSPSQLLLANTHFQRNRSIFQFKYCCALWRSYSIESLANNFSE